MDNRNLWQSQNFLKNPEFVKSLIEKTDINAKDLVIEIGAGKGTITRQLAKRARQVIAIEIDERLTNILRLDFKDYPDIKIVGADFLRWRLPEKPYKVFANIPFNMTADIIRKLTEDQNPPEVAYLIMQDKAAWRFMGSSVAKDSQISVFLRPWFEIGIVTNIERKEFAPIPKINAVLVRFRKRKQPLVEFHFRQWFRDFITYGYNQWQPTVLEAFRKVFTGKQRSIIARKINIGEAKPSDLTIEQWLKLFETFILYVPVDKKEIVRGAEKRLGKQQQKLKKWHRTR